MLKKILTLAFSLTLIFLGYKLYQLDVNKPLPSYCAFCNPDVIERQKFYEDDLVVACLSYKPTHEGHTLVIPKRHAQQFDQLTQEESHHIMDVIKKIAAVFKVRFGTTSYMIHQKNGYEAFQTVPHVHFHIIPRVHGHSSQLGFLFSFIKGAYFNQRLTAEQLKQEAAKMKAALEESRVAHHDNAINTCAQVCT